MYFMDFGGYQIVGSSPECLTRLTGDLVENFPIAGTRRRGVDAAEDERLAAELSADEKERAEHAMLVDLGRNDVGKVSRFGTVCVHDLMKVEYFSHVMHLVSRVQGRLAPGMDGPGALMACLPAGTVSGAPKLRAMQLIDELEPVKRGPYAGAVGYFDFRGGMDACIAIRTLLFKDGAVHAQAGGGVVADSEPALEFEETQNKLQALMRALGADEIPVTYTEPVCGKAARP
jgi:anthranilate synthase component 1